MAVSWLLNPSRFDDMVSGGAVEFDAAEGASDAFGSSPVETASWTIGTEAGRYLLAFTMGGGFVGATESAATVRHGGSGGTAVTALAAEVDFASGFGAGRAYGLAMPASGSTTTWAEWDGAPNYPQGMALIAAAYYGVDGVGDIQSNIDEVSSTTASIDVTVSTPNTTDHVVAFVWATGFSGTPTIDGAGGASNVSGLEIPFNATVCRVIHKARSGATTNISADLTGWDSLYDMGIIAVVLEAA